MYIVYNSVKSKILIIYTRKEKRDNNFKQDWVLHACKREYNNDVFSKLKQIKTSVY